MSRNMVLLALALVYMGLLGNVEALWRLQCEGVVALAPIDPIMSPGETSSHVHTVKGSNGMFVLQPRLNRLNHVFHTLKDTFLSLIFHPHVHH